MGFGGRVDWQSLGWGGRILDESKMGLGCYFFGWRFGNWGCFYSNFPLKVYCFDSDFGFRFGLGFDIGSGFDCDLKNWIYCHSYSKDIYSHCRNSSNLILLFVMIFDFNVFIATEIE